MKYNFIEESCVNDKYHLRMLYGFWKIGKANTKVAYEFFYRKNPWQSNSENPKSGYGVFCGISTFLYRVIKGFNFDALADYVDRVYNDEKFTNFVRYLSFSDLEIYSTDEGSIVFPQEPLVTMIGPISAIKIIESQLMTCINYESLIATKASRIRNIAKNKRLMEFGLRRAPSLMAGVLASRAAYIGGFDATSICHSNNLYDIPASGTHAHDWVQFFDDEESAFDNFIGTTPNGPGKSDGAILLIDSYDCINSGIENAIKIFKKYAACGNLPRPYGVRIDSGDLAYETKVVRKRLDEEGFEDAIIVVSNDLDEFLIQSLANQGAVIDAYGVGTKLVTCAGNSSFGGVVKLVSKFENGVWNDRMKLAGENMTKSNIPGIKNYLRISSNYGDDHFIGDIIISNDEKVDRNLDLILHHPELSTSLNVKNSIEGGTFKLEPMIYPVFSKNNILCSDDEKKCRTRHENQFKRFWECYTRLDNPTQYRVSLSDRVYNNRKKIIIDTKEHHMSRREN